MAVRVNKLLKELSLEIDTLATMLDALGVNSDYLLPNTTIPEEIATQVRLLCADDTDLFNLIGYASKRDDRGNQLDAASSSIAIGCIGSEANNPQEHAKVESNAIEPSKTSLKHSEKHNFWIDELLVLSPEDKVNRIYLGSFEEVVDCPLFSVLIGVNGVGKSMLMREIVEFFIDLYAYVKGSGARPSSVKQLRLQGVRYHIEGEVCEVIRYKKSYLAKINGSIQLAKDLHLPSIVACHFGAFEKFPIQKVNGATQTKYDVPYYKYVGAHVNGNMISSSAIAFRLLFALNEQMDDRRRENICTILDFIGYDHKISLSYTLTQKTRKNGVVRELIAQCVDKDRDYSCLNKREKIGVINNLYIFYKNKAESGGTIQNYCIDFDARKVQNEIEKDLQKIYKLKQYNLVSSVNVIFYKQSCKITSDEMSSGEFDMLATVLSISAASSDQHTLVLLDEPELSLHPNWQMTLINNLDKALGYQSCHLLISTHSHMLVSDLPMGRSAVIKMEKDDSGNLSATTISESTYGWSAEEVLLKVFNTATDRSKYLADVIGLLLKDIGENTISVEEVNSKLTFLERVSRNLSEVDPMKKIILTIIDSFSKS